MAVSSRDGNYDAFVAYQTELRDTHPDSPEVHMLLGHAQRMNGDLDAAIDSYRAALALAPTQRSLQKALDEVLRERASASMGSGVSSPKPWAKEAQPIPFSTQGAPP